MRRFRLLRYVVPLVGLRRVDGLLGHWILLGIHSEGRVEVLLRHLRNRRRGLGGRWWLSGGPSLVRRRAARMRPMLVEMAVRAAGATENTMIARDRERRRALTT